MTTYENSFGRAMVGSKGKATVRGPRMKLRLDEVILEVQISGLKLSEPPAQNITKPFHVCGGFPE